LRPYNTGASNEAHQTGNELIRLQASYDTLSERAKRVVKSGNEAEDTSCSAQLQMDLLTEDYGSLEAAARAAQDAREELERQLLGQSNENTAGWCKLQR